MNSWPGKLLRVNLTQGTWTVEDIDPQAARDYIGGRGLGTKMFCDEVSPNVDALSPENKLIFMTGILTGTRVPASTKFSCATKSPETGHYLCSNSGGLFGPYLKKAGYDGLIIEGKGGKPLYLIINDGRVTFIDAENYWGA